ncbi:ribonuclease Z [Flavobacterium sp.]|uniref:ribonuclease Z n=1 Tax=Flavobacterium sp. TaxID=239 RepID=UPI0022BDC69C|nr:ribonuclease Z [Flavobacterium sp.]MCZ8090563.1 ribonuclease Z [Flavobacterium sp.]
MKVDQKGHTTTIKNTQYKTAEFLTKFSNEYNSFKNQNLIIDLSTDKEIVMEDVKSFSELIKKHKKNKKSFVLVTDSIDYNKVPSSITLVPTLLEAHDIIEMEEIERDLGF